MEILSKLKWIKKTEITLPYDPGLILVETCMSYWWHQEVHLGKVAAMVQKKSHCTMHIWALKWRWMHHVKGVICSRWCVYQLVKGRRHTAIVCHHSISFRILKSKMSDRFNYIYY